MQNNTEFDDNNALNAVRNKTECPYYIRTGARRDEVRISTPLNKTYVTPSNQTYISQGDPIHITLSNFRYYCYGTGEWELDKTRGDNLMVISVGGYPIESEGGAHFLSEIGPTPESGPPYYLKYCATNGIEC